MDKVKMETFGFPSFILFAVEASCYLGFNKTKRQIKRF